MQELQTVTLTARQAFQMNLRLSSYLRLSMDLKEKQILALKYSKSSQTCACFTSYGGDRYLHASKVYAYDVLTKILGTEPFRSN